MRCIWFHYCDRNIKQKCPRKQMSHHLLFYKYSYRINYQSETGSVLLYRGYDVDCVEDIIENISFLFILGILHIENNAYFVIVKNGDLVGMYEGNNIFKITKVEILPLGDYYDNDTIFYLKYLIESHDFYVCNNQFTDDEFVWNLHMQDNFFKCEKDIDSTLKLQYQPSNMSMNSFLMGFVICGYFVSKTVKIDNDFFGIKLLSTVSCRKMGTRLLSRGIDTKGNVSFYVKTHVRIKKNSKTVFNFTTIRGTIPLFWMQKAKGLNGKVYFTGNGRVLEQAFTQHFDKLKQKYKNVVVVTLLGEKKDEKLLNDAYISLLTNNHLKHIAFDLNAHTKDFDNLQNVFFWHLDKIDKDDVVYRVNCIDCLDRTNLAQFLICKYKLEKTAAESNLYSILRECWTENGNSLSNLYTGSDVMKKELSLKQKRSFFGMFDDLMVSATRLINNRFTDKQKNKTFQILLGKDEQQDD